MLESIHIENIALIKNIDISFSPSFSAFTGETGAGKSIIIDSIGVICGNRVSKELIRTGESSAVVEAIFDNISERSLRKCAELGVSPDEDGYIYVSRTVSADGKGVVRINSKQVPLSLLREVSPFLINIHGQHDNQELLIKEKHRGILDRYSENSSLLDEYRTAFEKYCSLKRELDSVNTDETEKARRIEMLKFQINDIASLKLKPGEEDKLLAEKKKLTNIEKISRNASVVYDMLYGDGSGISACDGIDHAIEALNQLAKVADGMDEFIDRLSGMRSDIMDIAETVHDMAGETTADPAVLLDRLEQRLDDIGKAKRKYGSSEEEILEFLEKAKSELSEVEQSGHRTKELKILLVKSAEELKNTAKKLTDCRRKCADEMTEQIESELEYLEMSKVKFMVSIKEKPFSRDGADDIEFFVRTNSGQDFLPLCKTASGGELSRIMLAIKSVIAKKDSVDTLIFDEVDTGISGKTSRRIGIKLSQIARFSQVLCVTHSAQIASLASTHFLVSKSDDGDSTYTAVKALGKDERIEETARIIAGIDITDSARDAARELIEDRIL